MPHGSGGGIGAPKRGATGSSAGPPQKKFNSKVRPGSGVSPRVPGAASGAEQGLCFPYCAKLFGVANHKGCTFNPCRNQHPTMVAGSVSVAEKAVVKSQLSSMKNVQLQGEIFKALDAF